MEVKQLELYIHIPFCKRKCNYCDFISFAGKEDLIEPYVESLCREIGYYGQFFKGRKIRSVYIGGGTPSILNCEQISRIAETLADNFLISGTHEKRRGLFLQKKIRPLTEFSIECNPGTVDREKLKAYRKLGINRLSIGLQSSDERDLKVLGRIHSYDDFVNSFEWARESGFDNINVDLMQAIPGQTLADWKRVLAVIGTWMPEHISAYSLIVEEGTLFQQMQEEGKLDLPDEDMEREIYYYTKDFLGKAGYDRYEISNYARPGFECIHNTGYWQRADYLGLGLNASSMLHLPAKETQNLFGQTEEYPADPSDSLNIRWKNTAELHAYLEAFSGGNMRSSGKPGEQAYVTETDINEAAVSIREECQVLSHKEQMEEFVFLGLRMTEGISRRRFLENFGQDLDFTFADTIEKYKSLNLLESEGDMLRFTDRGLDVSNTVLADFIL